MAMNNNRDDFYAKFREKYSLGGGTQETAASSIPTPGISKYKKETIGKIEYNAVPMSALYDRMSDGSYVAKYKNYQGATGNEDRLAREQSFWDKAGNGLAKNSLKMANYFLDSTIGTVAGVINGISEGSLDAVWDNDFSNKLDDWNKKLDNQLPNYYTDEEKSMNFLQSLGTSNFWFNDFANGLAFVGGAILPSVALSAFTGGTSLGVGLGRTALKSSLKGFGDDVFKAASKKLAKETLTEVEDKLLKNQGKDLLRAYSKANYWKRGGDLVGTTSFLLNSANFEAGMEARHNYKEAVTNFFNGYEEANGKPPSLEDFQDFSSKATSAANGVYLTNMAILSVSNAAMFGKTLDINIIPKAVKTDFKNFTNKAIGLNIEKSVGGLATIADPTKGQKLLGRTLNILEKPATEGLFEEGLQGVAGTTMQNYLESTYDPEKKYAENFMANLGSALQQQYGTKEGWKEIGIGMLIGYIGGAFQKTASADGKTMSRSLPGFGNQTYKSKLEAKKLEVESINKGLQNLQQNLTNRGASANTLRAMAKANSARANRNNVESGFTSLDATRTNLDFIQSQEGIRAESHIIDDYNTVVDQMEVSTEEADKLANVYNIQEATAEETQKAAIAAYKADLKNEFNNTLKDYKFAQNAVDSIGIGRFIPKGEQLNVRDAMIWNIMVGKDALKNGTQVAEEIQKMVGVDGITDALMFYNTLDKRDRQITKEISKRNKEIERYRQTTVDAQQELARLQTERKGKKSDEALDRKIKNASEKYVVASQQLIKLQEEQKQAKDTLKDRFEASNFNIDSKTISDTFVSPETIIDTLEKLDTFEDGLRRNGKVNEANAIAQMRLESTQFMDMHREFMMAHARMRQANFFETGEGKGLLGKLMGPTYQMSEETIKLIRENDAIIDASLERLGVTRGEDMASEIKRAIENNPDLSEREKFRLESIIRLTLNQQAFDNIAEEIAKYTQDVEMGVETKSDVNTGDTLALKRKLNIKQENLGSVELLDDAIQQITSQIDSVRKTAQDPNQIKDLEQRLIELEQRREEIKSGTQETQTTKIQTVSTQTVEELGLEQLKNELAIEEASAFRNQEIVDTLKGAIILLEEKIARDNAPNSTPKDADVAQEVQQSFNDAEKVLFPDSPQGSTLFGDMTEQMDLTLNLAESGMPVPLEDLKKLNDYLYQVYKNILNLKRTAGTEAQDSLGYTKEYLEGLQRELEQTLNFLADYGTSLKTNEPGTSLPVFNVSPERAIYETTSERTAEDDRASQERDEQVEKQIDKLQKDATKENQQQEQEIAGQSGTSQYSGTGSRQQEEGQSQRSERQTSQSETDNRYRNLTSEEEIDAEIAKVEEELSKAKEGFKIVSSDEYIRYNELSKKEKTSGLTDEEMLEKDSLQEDIDAWMFATGSVLDGVRLSDLIEQKVALQQAQVNKQEDVIFAEESDVIESTSVLDADNIKDKKRAINSNLGQTYDAVIVSRVKKDNKLFFEISGVDKNDVPMFFSYTDENGDVVADTEVEYELNQDTGNILVSQEQLERFNQRPTRRISIVNLEEKIARNYSPAIMYHTDMSGNEVGGPIPSEKSKDYEIEQDIDAVYNLQDTTENSEGSELQLVIDTRDAYNKQVITEFNKARETYNKVLDEEGTKEEVKKKLDANTEYQTLKREALSLQAKKSAKEITKAETERLKSVKSRLEALKKATETDIVLKKEKKIEKAKESLEKAKSKLKSKIRITALSDGKTVLTMKGKVSEEKELQKDEDVRYQEFRDSIIENEELLEKIVESGVGIVEIPHNKLTVQQVLIGMPNFNFRKDENGVDTILFENFTPESAKKVVDIGYVVDGKIQTRTGEKGINTTFLTKTMKKASKGQKIPFVVLKRGGKRIAFPVRIGEVQRPDNSDIKTIFESDVDTKIKVRRINELLAERGLDVKLPGNSFYVIGGMTNLTSQNINDVIGRLENIEYLYPIDEWTKDNTPIVDILTQQAAINVNVSKPVHSPKVKMDMSQLLKDFTGVAKTTTTESKKATKAKKEKAVGKKSDIAARYSNTKSQKDIDREAQENAKKDC